METKKQTAVDLLRDRLMKEFGFAYSDNIHEELKAMEKEQHYKSYRRGNLFLDEGTLDFEYYFEQYYTSTYG